VSERGVLGGVKQAARVLEALAEAPGGLRLTDIATVLGIPKPTAHRIVRTWSTLGYVEADPQERYRLSWKLFELAAAHQKSVDLRSLARHHLVAINAECGETTHLTVLDHSEVLYVDMIESRDPIRVYAAIGRRAPLHATAAGKAMLAYQPSSFLDSFVSKGLETFTGRTITRTRDLEGELESIRERGYAVNLGEWHTEVGAVAAPIFRFDGAVSAALCVGMPSASLTPAKIEELSQLLVRETMRLSSSLGHVDGKRPAYQTLKPDNALQAPERSVV
jgi:IclR family transcriptional regulator, KDG regulon repressor